MKMEQSMSRKGNCWDNAPMERFFRSLKHEQLHYEKFRTKASAKLSIIDYLAFYNWKRTHSTLDYQSPLKFERVFYKKVS
jgi:putative transposase